MTFEKEGPRRRAEAAPGRLFSTGAGAVPAVV
jgi:hypothetical protein